MGTTANILLLLAWVFLTVSVLSWLMMRANAQIRRFRDEPTPRTAYKRMQEDLEELDIRVLANKRKIDSVELSIQDTMARLVSLQNRISAQKRRDETFDPTQLADYILAQQQDEGVAPESADDLLPTIAHTADGQQIDFR